MSMVDGFPYKEEVGGSSPSVPTIVNDNSPSVCRRATATTNFKFVGTLVWILVVGLEFVGRLEFLGLKFVVLLKIELMRSRSSVG